MRSLMLALLVLSSARPQSTTVSLWPDSATPANPSANDAASVELGIKFQSDVDGSVIGVRFYKSSANTGTHLGNLWTATGTNLAAVTFTGETASGWQHMNFPNPVPITANTIYVVSYFCPAGHYAGDTGYFAVGYDNAPLHAPKDGAQGGNGVYLYGGSSAFPTQTYQSSNYWVDLIFSASAPPPPPPPPPSPPAPAPRSASGSGSSDSSRRCGCGWAGAPSWGWPLWAAAIALALLGAGAGRR